MLCSAVCLNGHPLAEEEFNTSKLVLIGEVVRTHRIAASKNGTFLEGDVYDVVPTAMFKGRKSRIVSLFSENSSGRFPMELRRKYILFIHQDGPRLVIDNCGNSGPVESSEAVIAAVTKLSHE